MTNRITQGTVVITPTQLLGFSGSRPSGNMVHPIPGRPTGDPDVTLRPAGTRTGTLKMGFHGTTSEADSLAAELAHQAGGVFSLITDRASVIMYYVTSEGGQIVRELEEESRDAWIVSVDYQEVTL